MTVPSTGWRPIAVAAVRAIVLAGASAAIGAAIVFVTSTPARSLAPFAPVLIAGLRLAEGWVDQARGQARQTPGGSAPASSTAYLPPNAAAAAHYAAAGAPVVVAALAQPIAPPPATPPAPVVAESSVEHPPEPSPATTADASTLPPPADPPGPETVIGA